MQSWIVSIITPVFSVTWSFRNHSNMLLNCNKMWLHNVTVLWYFWLTKCSLGDHKRFLALLFVYSKQRNLSDLFECLMCGRQKQSLFFSFVFSAHICIPVVLWLPWRIRLLWWLPWGLSSIVCPRHSSKSIKCYEGLLIFELIASAKIPVRPSWQAILCAICFLNVRIVK